MSYKALCRWLLLVHVLEVPRRGQVENQGQLLLVLDLEQLRKKYGLCKGKCCLLEKL